MKKLLLLLLAVAAAVVLSRAQGTGTLKGTVKDEAGQPIPFVNMSLLRQAVLVAGSIGNIDGEFLIKPITPGIYDVKASFIGYQEIVKTSVKIMGDSTTTLDFVLKRGTSNSLNCVVVESRKFSVIQKDQTVQSTTFSKQELKAMPSRDASASAQITGGVNSRNGQAALRGSRGTPPAYGEAHTNEYRKFEDNRFLASRLVPLSTFSVDVDKASYSVVRKHIADGVMPPADAVRVEELVNYFDYNYPDPIDEHPFRIVTELTECPWNKESRILKLALQGKRIQDNQLPPSVFTFLVDVSGSMVSPNKLPLVKASLLKLLDKMRPQDKVGIVVYAGAAGVVLTPQTVGKKSEVVAKIMEMEAGGSTAGGQGIQLAYKLAGEHFVKDGNNRIILCTDGDFNVGISSDSDLASLIEKEREKGIYLTVLGYGMGNYKDSKLETLADKGNGNYAYIDDYAEAEKFLGREFAGSMYTIAKDVKIQIEFNPQLVQSYRLIGYENRVLAAEDFNDDKKDAGEIGAGHTVTALYEIRTDEKYCGKIDALKYQKPASPAEKVPAGEMATVKFRYKKPDGDKSILLEKSVSNDTKPFKDAEENTRFAVSVAAFGQLLRKSEYVKDLTLAQISELATAAQGTDTNDLRKEFLQMLKDYKKLAG